MALADILLDTAHPQGRRAMREALGIRLGPGSSRSDRRLAARAGLLPGHAFDAGTAARLQAQAQAQMGAQLGQGPELAQATQPATGPVSLSDLLGVKPAGAGGPGDGKPVVSSGPVVGGSGMFAGRDPLAAAAASPLASLATGLSPAQQQARGLRSQLAGANGLDPNVAFYGPHADPRARALLRGGSGLGRGLGAARYRGRR